MLDKFSSRKSISVHIFSLPLNFTQYSLKLFFNLQMIQCDALIEIGKAFFSRIFIHKISIKTFPSFPMLFFHSTRVDFPVEMMIFTNCSIKLLIDFRWRQDLNLHAER